MYQVKGGGKRRDSHFVRRVGQMLIWRQGDLADFLGVALGQCYRFNNGI